MTRGAPNLSPTAAADPQPARPGAAVRRPPAWVALLVTALAIGSMAVVRLDVLADRILPIGYGVPIVVFIWLRDRRYLWGAALGFTVVSALKHFWLVPTADLAGDPVSPADVWASFALQVLDLAVIALAVHSLIGVRDWLERRNAELEAANREIAARQEELARSNEELMSQAEELQSQSEELERQSEELRTANEELGRREQSLQTLLSLSRTLRGGLSRAQTLAQVCETLARLQDGFAAAAILELDGDRFVVRCHHGFGPGGPRADAIPRDGSFAAVVLEHNRTAYIEDLAHRPDLQVPQPKSPAERPVASVLAAPLRAGGRPVGTLEAYRRDPGPWDDEHVALIESLAAQASVSLEAGELFETVAGERGRLEAVLRTVPFGIAVSDATGSDIRLNPAGAALLHLPADANLAEEWAARPWRLFEAGKEIPAAQRPILRALRDGREVRAAEIEMVRPDGGRRLALLAHAAPIRDAGNAIVGAVVAFADITAQKELQRELDARRREAEEANVRKTRFLAAVSHDIRTPANAISLLAELIRRAATNPAMAAEVPDMAQELHGSAMALVNLLGDVLDLARFDSGRIELTESEFSLNDLLADEHRRMQPLAQEKGIGLHLALPERPVRVRTDRIKLSRVVNNLVGNAIKFTEGGEVRVEVGDEPVGGNGGGGGGGGGPSIRVIDTGIGIAPEHQGHIFDEFFQLRNPERDRNKGTGLGLTICKRLVDAMGGRLWVESAPGRGSTFTVTLPPSAVVPAPANP